MRIGLSYENRWVEMYIIDIDIISEEYEYEIYLEVWLY